MPIETTFINDKGVIGKASGLLTGSDVIQFNERIYSSLQLLSKLRYKFMDYRDVSSINVTIEDLKTLAEQDVVASNWNSNLRIAVVIKEELHHCLVKIWQSYTNNSSLTTKIFTNIDEAQEWINSSLP